MTVTKAGSPIDTKFLLCKGFGKLMDVTGGEEDAVAGIKGDLINQDMFLLSEQSLTGVGARSTMDPLEVIVKS